MAHSLGIGELGKLYIFLYKVHYSIGVFPSYVQNRTVTLSLQLDPPSINISLAQQSIIIAVCSEFPGSFSMFTPSFTSSLPGFYLGSISCLLWISANASPRLSWYAFGKHSAWTYPVLGSEHTKENTAASALLGLRGPVGGDSEEGDTDQPLGWPESSLGFLHSRMGKPSLPWCSGGWEPARQCRRHRFGPWSGKSPRAAGRPSAWAAVAEPVLCNQGTVRRRAASAPAPRPRPHPSARRQHGPS